MIISGDCKLFAFDMVCLAYIFRWRTESAFALCARDFAGTAVGDMVTAAVAERVAKVASTCPAAQVH